MEPNLEQSSSARRSQSSAQDFTKVSKTIKELVAKGDKATKEAEAFYKQAGQKLKWLKQFHKEHSGGEVSWTDFVNKYTGLKRSRADELIRIAEGQTTLGAVRAKAREGMAATRKRQRHNVTAARSEDNSQSVVTMTNETSKVSVPPEFANTQEAATNEQQADEAEAAKDAGEAEAETAEKVIEDFAVNVASSVKDKLTSLVGSDHAKETASAVRRVILEAKKHLAA
jgi:hypothetical protein